MHEVVKCDLVQKQNKRELSVAVLLLIISEIKLVSICC